MAPTKASKNQPTRLKLVVRRLPPDLPELVFWRSVAPWVAREETDAVQPAVEAQEGAELVSWAVYKPGKVRKSGQDKDSVHSRAYISFKTPEALVAFHRGYDGWQFRDKQGNVSQAVVEFAPYQRLPVAPSKQDPRRGTIDEDTDFLAFSEALKAAPVPVQMPTETAIQAPKTTPLIDHLRQQKAAERAARKQAAAIKKGKQPAILPGATKAQLATAAQGGVQGAGPKGGKNGKKEKGGGKDKKGKGKASKEASRSGTPVPGGGEGGAGGGGGGGKKQHQPSSRGGSTPSSAPQTPLAPGQIPFPVGSVGAQQQAQRNATLQAQLVRQQLQAQHQRQQGGGARAPQAAAAPAAPPGLAAPQPQILRNPARAPSQSSSPAPGPPPTGPVQAIGPGALAGAQIAAQQQQQQRRQQAGAAMTGVLGEGMAARQGGQQQQQQQGQGQGQRGKGGRGGGGGGRGGGRGRGGGGGRGRGGRGGGRGGAAAGAGGGAAP
ncbi:hypothetical protein JCM6882_006653 [Rhodosporidiobolus microsporus]